MQTGVTKMKNIIKIVIIVLVLSIPAGYAWGFFNLFSMSTEEEVEVGRRIARSIETKMPIYRDRAYEKKLYRIGYAIVKVCGRKDLEYNFTIIDEEDINAFATFGGYIYINKGAIDAMDSDDELASIIAHEVGHVSAKHLAKSMEKSKLFSFGFFALDAFVLRKEKHGKDIRRVVNVAYNIIQRGYSREDELEADRLGVRYCHRAGYNPLAALKVMEKVKEQKRRKGKTSPFENVGILRTHPYIDERMDAVISEVSEMKAEEAFRKHSEKE